MENPSSILAEEKLCNDLTFTINDQTQINIFCNLVITLIY